MRQDNKEEIKFIDAEDITASYDKSITFKDIVLRHLQKISTFASVEFRGGYWEERPFVSGGMSGSYKTYVPDTREVYSNAVEYLADILYPHFDEQMINEEKELTKIKEQAFDKYSRKVDSDSNKQFDSTTLRRFYREACLSANKKLFRSLCSFLYRKRYLELGVLED